MSWAGPLDDGMCFHAKILAAGNEATGAWARAISWCACHLTDGKVPRAVALAIGPESVWNTLVSVRLAELDGDGWLIHDYKDWNPSAKDVKAAKARKARNSQAFRQRRVTGDATGDGIGDSPPELPVSSRSSLPLPSSDPITETKIPAAADLERRARAPGAAPAGVSHPDPDIEEILTHALREPKLARIGTVDVFDVIVRSMPVGGRKVQSAYRQAIVECALDTPQGEVVTETLKRLRKYMTNALPPRQTPVSAQALTPEQKAQWEDEKKRLRGANG